MAHSAEIHAGIVVRLFATAVFWISVTLTGRPEWVVVREDAEVSAESIALS